MVSSLEDLSIVNASCVPCASFNDNQGWHRPVSSVVWGLRTDGTRFYRLKSSSKYRLSSVCWDQDESRRSRGLFRRYETIGYRTKNYQGRHRTRDGRN